MVARKVTSKDGIIEKALIGAVRAPDFLQQYV